VCSPPFLVCPLIVNPRRHPKFIPSLIGLSSHPDRTRQLHAETTSTIASINRLQKTMSPIVALPEVTMSSNYYPSQVAMRSPVPSTSPQTIRGEHVGVVTHYLRSVGYVRVDTFFRDCQVLRSLHPSRRNVNPSNLVSQLPLVAVVHYQYPHHTTELGQMCGLRAGYGVDHRTQDCKQCPITQGTQPIVPPSRRHHFTVACDGSDPIVALSLFPEN